MIYLAIIIYCSLFIVVTKKVTTSVQLIGLFPLIIFSVFRGASGPDTETYTRLFYQIDIIVHNGISYLYEPLTPLIMYSSSLLSDKKEYFFAIHSLLLSLCFLYLCRNYKVYRFFLLTVGIVFLVDGLTNTLRISLGYVLFLIGITVRQRTFFILAFSSHVSILIAAIFYKCIELFSEVRRGKMYILLLMAVGGGLSVVAMDFVTGLFPVVSEKLLIYQELQTTSKFSGLSDIFVIFSLLVIGSYYNRYNLKRFMIDIFFIIALCVFLFSMVSLSLAVLRIIKLFVLVIACSPFLLNSRKPIPSWPLVLVGGLYTANFFRIVVQSNGYLPYGN
jgi:hypothetical protein